MAYRFLLQVPEALAAEASIAVAETDDAQVVLARNSHGGGFDDPDVDLTIAAHSLGVIDSLYTWFDRIGASQPNIRIVLHSGDRLALEAHDRASMIAAIRRDQPWVERTIPKIGEHEPPPAEAFADQVMRREEQSIDAAGANVAGASGELAVAGPGPAVAAREAEPAVRIHQINYITLRVNDLAKAERFYGDFFGMQLRGRARRTATGELQFLDGTYNWAEARRQGTEADVTYMRNGPLELALTRAGLGARLERTVLDSISIGVDAITFTDLKSRILMRSYETLGVSDTGIMFRDPFGVAWDVRVRGSDGSALMPSSATAVAAPPASAPGTTVAATSAVNAALAPSMGTAAATTPLSMTASEAAATTAAEGQGPTTLPPAAAAAGGTAGGGQAPAGAASSTGGETTAALASGTPAPQTAGAAASPRLPAGAVAGAGAKDCPAGYPIKGNGSSLIYHLPGGRYYSVTVPEMCFATEEAAVAAGFRPYKRPHETSGGASH